MRNPKHSKQINWGDGCTFNKDPRVSRMIKNDGGMTATARDGQIYRILSGKDPRDLK